MTYVLRMNGYSLRLICVLALLSCVACSGFRQTFRGMFNSDLRGQQAPKLTSTDWVDPLGFEGMLARDADWKVLVLFRPG